MGDITYDMWMLYGYHMIYVNMSTIVHIGPEYDAEWHYQYALSHGNGDYIELANMIEAANHNHKNATLYLMRYMISTSPIILYNDNDDFVNYIDSSIDRSSTNSHWSYLLKWYHSGCDDDDIFDKSVYQNNPLAIIHNINDIADIDEIKLLLNMYETCFEYITDEFPYILCQPYIRLGDLYNMMADDDVVSKKNAFDMYFRAYQKYECGCCPCDLLLNMGTILNELNEYEDSIIFITEYLERNQFEAEEDKSWSYALIADSYYCMDNEDVEKAWEYGNKAISVCGGIDNVLLSSAVLLIASICDDSDEYGYRHSDISRAKKYYKRCIEIDRNPIAMNRLGILYKEKELEDAKALRYWRMAHYECYDWATCNMVIHYFNEQNMEKCHKWVLKCLEKYDDPTEDIYYFAYQTHKYFEMHEEALRYLDMGIAANDECCIALGKGETVETQLFLR